MQPYVPIVAANQQQSAPPGGPTQPEVQTFTPVSANDLVNPFTGAFSYNIPLIDVGGFPVNISYNPNIGMEEEASCVGLGWALNIGSVNRVVRGLPDDFNGTDKLVVEENRQDEVEIGISPGAEVEIFGKAINSELVRTLAADKGNAGAGLSWWLNYNNYTGWSSSLGLDLSAELQKSWLKPKGGAELNASSSEGFSVKGYAGASGGNDNLKGGFKTGYKYASLTGGKELSFGLNLSSEKGWKGETAVNSSFKSYAPFYPPPSRFPNESSIYSFSLKLGQEFAYVRPHGTISGYVRKEVFEPTTHHQPAYGYFYEHLSKGDENFILDCQREQDGWVNEKYPQQPVSHQTYDWFNVSGMGISGEFRAFRHDYYMVGNGTIEECLKPELSRGVEVAAGGLLGIGGNFSLTLSTSTSGMWYSDNQLINSAFDPFNSGDGSVEISPVYFKDVSELTPLSAADEHDFKLMGDVKPMTAKVELGEVKNVLLVGDAEIDANQIKRNQEGALKHAIESPRIKTFRYLNAAEASARALVKPIEAYPFLNSSRPAHQWKAVCSQYDRLETNGEIGETKRKKPHHVSEINVLKEDGSRYVYGIPVYNTLSKDVSFNVSRNNIDRAPGTKLVKYAPNEDNTFGNTNGVDESFRSTTTPAYAHAFLLTAVLSDDYVDVDQNGPTENDLGSYTRLNYSKVASDFKWRIPFYKNHANYDEGTNMRHGADDGDDQGNYSYGEKELWYVQSIETKNYVALFYMSNRDDGYGVRDENGGIDAENPALRQKKLDSIKVYVKSDLLANTDRALPVKRVVFQYDYSLCPGVPYNKNYADAAQRNGEDGWRSFLTNADASTQNLGKLTLKKVYFTYRNSSRSAAESYDFEYQENKPYHPMGFNRWGGYASPVRADGFSNDEFPYVSFDKAMEDRNAKAWTLHKINLPSGAVLEVDYECNDYAFVQDKKASSMVKLKGFAEYKNAAADNVNDHLYSGSEPSSRKRYLYFELPSVLNGKSEAEKLQALAEMTKELGALYFSCNVNTGRLAGTQEYYERINSFIPMPSEATGYVWELGKDYGLSADKNAGWIDMMAADDGSYNYHPVTEAMVKYIKENLPNVAFNERPISEDVLENLEAIGVAIGNIFSTLTKSSLTEVFYDDGRGKKINAGESYIRLFTPGGRKLGGGKRVKKISISDRWGAMVNKDKNDNGEKNQKYVIVYSYTQIENGKKISSGVAAFEPGLGQDENSMQMPFKLKSYQFPKDNPNHLKHISLWSLKNRTLTTPFGASYFPAAQIGYASVKVYANPINPENPSAPDNSRSASGHTEYEFYTARDFPVHVAYTKPYVYLKTNDLMRAGKAPEGVDDASNVGNTTLNLLSNSSFDYLTISQGYAVVLNNMHGKTKGVKKFAEGNSTPIQYTQYYYRTNNDGSEVKLKNTFLSMNSAGEISERYFGVTYDIIPDSRMFDFTSGTGGVAPNVDITGTWATPVPAFSVWPIFGAKTTEIHQMSITKAIYMNGLVDSVVVTDMGQKLTTKNLLLDSETGEVVVNATPNEFNDYVYSTNIPAHWMATNTGMMPNYKTENISLKNVPNSNRDYTIASSDVFAMLVPGDELLAVKPDGSSLNCWVAEKTTVGANKIIRLIDLNGRYLTASLVKLSIHRSAYRNLLGYKSGSVTTMQNPIQTGNAQGLYFDKVVSASAVEYTDKWQSYKINRYAEPVMECICTDAVENLKRTPLTQILEKLMQRVAADTLFLSDTRIPYTDDDVYLKRRFGGDALQWKGSIEGSNTIRLQLNGNEIELTAQGSVRSFCSVLGVAELKVKQDEVAECTEKGRSFSVKLKLQACLPNNQGNYETFEHIFNGTSSAIQFKVCTLQPIALDNERCGDEIDFTYNPFVNNTRGNFRQIRSLAYDTSRTYDDKGLRYQGFYKSFHSCWAAANRIANPYDLRHWKWTVENSKIDSHGKMLEQTDKLGVSSSTYYGFSNSVEMATASNAKFTQIGYEGFEDFAYANRSSASECLNPVHWIDVASVRNDIVSTEAHTGKYSLRLQPLAGLGRTVTLDIGSPLNSRPDREGPFQFARQDRAGKFAPEAGSYLVSAWVKVNESPVTSPGLILNPTPSKEKQPVDNYENAKITCNGVELDQRSDIIDGWQQIWGAVEITNGSALQIKLSSGATTTFFDDLRIQPFQSVMNTFVYDPESLRLAAVLDENNFATFYEYDGEGELVRTKRETENGIITLQEVDTGAARKIRSNN